MDTFHDAPPGQVPDGWTEFILSGNPSFAQDGDTFWGPPSLRIRHSERCVQGGHLYAGARAARRWLSGKHLVGRSEHA